MTFQKSWDIVMIVLNIIVLFILILKLSRNKLLIAMLQQTDLLQRKTKIMSEELLAK